MDERIRDNISLGELNMLHIFIVSLRQDVEKRAAISKTLNNFNLNFTFIDAIYGRELPSKDIEQYKLRRAGLAANRGYPLTPGEIGCTLSHLSIYQEIIDKQLSWACILEDDAILDKRFKVFIDKFDASNMNPENLYILGGQNGLQENKIIKSIKHTKIIGNQTFHKTIKSEDIIYRTCCYLMSQSMAKDFISSAKENFILADDWDYLVKNQLIKNIYLSDFVDHPLDLTHSALQKERKDALLEKTVTKKNIILRLPASIKWRLRPLAPYIYNLLEKRNII